MGCGYHAGRQVLREDGICIARNSGLHSGIALYALACALEVTYAYAGLSIESESCHVKLSRNAFTQAPGLTR